MIDHQTLLDAIPHCLTQTDLPLPQKYPGKVRDTYDLGDGRLLLITTDRQSGFDRNLGAIPFKGQVLNRTSLYLVRADKAHRRQSRARQPARQRSARAQVHACCRLSSSCAATSPARPAPPSGRSTPPARASSAASRCPTA